MRTQLDALQTERNALEAENRHLREDRLEQIAALQANQELVASRWCDGRKSWKLSSQLAASRCQNPPLVFRQTGVSLMTKEVTMTLRMEQDPRCYQHKGAPIYFPTTACCLCR